IFISYVMNFGRKPCNLLVSISFLGVLCIFYLYLSYFTKMATLSTFCRGEFGEGTSNLGAKKPVFNTFLVHHGLLGLNSQCTIIRTTELAAAQEKLAELERQKEETLKTYSPSLILEKLHGKTSMIKVEEESEVLHRQLLDKEIDLATSVQKYKKLRNTHHRRALIHLAAKTSGF
ncbi:hypothetical protein BHM03_00052669, partial [Ensete ventricosum]